MAGAVAELKLEKGAYVCGGDISGRRRSQAVPCTIAGVACLYDGGYSLE